MVKGLALARVRVRSMFVVYSVVDVEVMVVECKGEKLNWREKCYPASLFFCPALSRTNLSTTPA